MSTQESGCVLVTKASTGTGAIYTGRSLSRGSIPILVAYNQHRTDTLAERLVREQNQAVEVATGDHRATYREIGFWKIVIWATLLLTGAISMLDPVELLTYFAAAGLP